MRVLLISDFYEPYVGGVEQHVRTLAHALTDRGHAVLVVTTATDRAPAGRVTDGPVAVERIATATSRIRRLHADPLRPWAPPVPDPLAAWRLRRIIATWAPDVVHGHDWLARSALPWCRRPGAAPGRRNRPPLVQTQHYFTRSCARKDRWRLASDGSEAPCPGPTVARCVACATRTYGVVGPVVAAAARVGAALDDRWATTVAVSASTAALNGSPDATVIPNPVTGPADEVDVSRGTLDMNFPSTDYLLFVGDQRPTKGLPVLLEALAVRSSALPLVVVGERDRHAPDRYPDGVTWTGPLPHAEVLGLMAAARVVIVPSVWDEPFGLVAVEAHLTGRPVIATAVGGLVELVDDGVTGVVVPPGDVGRLAAAIDRLSLDAELADGMGRAGQERAADFSPVSVAARLLDVYEVARRDG